MIKLGPNSIAPIHQDKPPLWSVIAVVAFVMLALAPFFYVMAAILGVVP